MYFQISAASSSFCSALLYREMSLWSVRTRMTPTMPVRKSTMMSELMIENQWMLVFSADCRYESQREAHLSDEARNTTEYV